MRMYTLSGYKAVLCDPLFVYATCYWQDQPVADPQSFRTCNSIATGVNGACCGVSDTCSKNGYCFGIGGFMYRGVCTEIDWNAQACFRLCRIGFYHLALITF